MVICNNSQWNFDIELSGILLIDYILITGVTYLSFARMHGAIVILLHMRLFLHHQYYKMLNDPVTVSVYHLATCLLCRYRERRCVNVISNVVSQQTTLISQQVGFSKTILLHIVWIDVISNVHYEVPIIHYCSRNSICQLALLSICLSIYISVCLAMWVNVSVLQLWRCLVWWVSYTLTVAVIYVSLLSYLSVCLYICLSI